MVCPKVGEDADGVMWRVAWCPLLRGRDQIFGGCMVTNRVGGRGHYNQ